ncbi:MAG TPA: OmpA family protein [Thermoanaerobaculia bacterium]|jgi:outer membrane protein OmpA-like peptidoglycan-associated protein|nr:OmpA family protein [Thermoanaerobaculia bacterium]
MALRRLATAVALLAVPVLAAAGEPPYAGPWDPAAESAAEAAVARLGAKRALALTPRVLAIRGLASGLVATVQDVQRAMRDLGAKETDLEVRVELPADVLFDFDKADIRADAARALAQVATLIHAYPSGSATLEGHTDSKGDDAYNQGLSKRRAEAVERWLVEKEGIEAARLTPRGYGESRPVASNDDEAGRQRNRRVEVVIRKQ